MLRKLILIIALALSAVAIVACGGSNPAPTAATAKTNSPTTNGAATVAVPATSAVVVPTLSIPTRAPTVAGPTRAPSPTSDIPSASVVPSALAKTRAATSFTSMHVLNLSQAFGAQYDSMMMVRVNGEFSNKDAHLRFGGAMLASVNPKQIDELEVYQVGGQTYVHGPAAAVGAPDNKWYVLPGDLSMTGPANTFYLYDQIAQLPFDWSVFKYDGSSINGPSRCDSFTAGKDVASKTLPIIGYSGVSAPVIDDGSISFSACNDGYLHGLSIKLTGHDPSSPDKKGVAELSDSFSGFDSKIAIVAPTGAVAASKPANTFALAEPTPYAQVAASAPAASSYDGTWEGKNSTNSIINFVVVKNQITNASLNYSVLNTASERPSDCPLGDGGAHSGTVDPTPITGTTFTLKAQGGGETKLTFTGTFKSATTAGGTLHLQGTLPFCNKPYETEVTWTATKK